MWFFSQNCLAGGFDECGGEEPRVMYRIQIVGWPGQVSGQDRYQNPPRLLKYFGIMLFVLNHSSNVHGVGCML